MTASATYTNPVYDQYFADPFVLRRGGAYYAYGTLPLRGRTVPALTSPDLVRWTPLGDVLEPLDQEVENYWAPEVAYADGTFWMYYSAGGEEGIGHQLRVACAEEPSGPFADCGIVLDPDEPFTIDAHPFRDDDGSWYLFFCRDFLDVDDRPGTGIVVDRLTDMRTLAGDRREVVLPYADWNLFLADREWYGRTWPGWYTVEGPFVRKRDGRYYCFFSGGAWREPTYGLSYAVADHPLGPWEVADGDGPTILRTVPDAVLGPGHASIVSSPSGAEDWIVYHAWDPAATARLMRIDRLEWTADGPRCEGPTLEPRAAPA
ncbi:MAG: glycoside hydrolase family 43 protein [Actinomycetota bacterium]|nr:glycoside hydrolase family 43 protein [Actinomycetota bacterium]